MAKTLKQMFEVYEPKSGDEKKFVDKHIVVKTKDANGNEDDVFQGTNVNKIDRSKEAHGYNPGDDEKVYEEADEQELETFLLELYASCDEEERKELEDLLDQEGGLEQLLTVLAEDLEEGSDDEVEEE